MSRALGVLGVVVGVLLLGTGTASAGGGTWFFEGQTLNAEAVLIPGDRVRAETLLWLKGVEPRAKDGGYWAGPDQGPFFGYISGQERQAWGPIAPPLPKDAMRIGEVRFTETKDPNVLDVSLDFTLPDLEPGYYMLHHCNVPCSRQIGDTMSTPFTVVEDTGQALLASRLSRVSRQVGRIRPVLDNRTDNVREESARLAFRLRSLEKRIVDLEARPAAVRVPNRDDRPPIAWALAGAGAVLLTLIGLRGLRRGLGRRAEPHPG